MTCAGRATWNKYRSQLTEAFRDLCAYSAQRLNQPGEVDHFVSIDEDRSYRLAAGWINSSKQSLRSVDIIDPFEVEDDWFELILPSLQLRVTELCPAELRDRANYTLTRLHLRDDERVIRYRRYWLTAYERGEASLELWSNGFPCSPEPCENGGELYALGRAASPSLVSVRKCNLAKIKKKLSLHDSHIRIWGEAAT